VNTTKTYGSITIENLNESSYGPPQTPSSTSRALRSLPPAGHQLPQQASNDDDCYYRLRTLKITTEDGRTWEILHWQYLAWGDHGKKKIF
jgi:hypothetical protein